MSCPRPIVSVLVATWNQAPSLDRALQSLRHQTMDRSMLDIIIVDDGSTDETSRLLAGYRDEATVITTPHAGLAAACNTGLAAARGRYLIRVDSDDAAEPALLEAELAVLERAPDIVCVSSDRYEESDGTVRLVRVREGALCDLIACGALMRLEDVRAVGGYRPLFWEEYDLFLRLKPQGRFAHVPAPLYRYSRRSDSMTATRERRRKGWEELLALWGPQALRALGAHAELEEAAARRLGSERN